MNISWYLLILVFLEVINMFGAGWLSPLQSVPLRRTSGAVTMREPGYDFVNNTKKWRKVRSGTTFFPGVSLQVIEQTSVCKALEAVSLSQQCLVTK